MSEKKITVSFCIPEELVKQLDRIADEWKVSRSAALRILVLSRLDSAKNIIVE